MFLDAAALLAALSYGFFGSFHCVLMCGPLAILPGGVHEADQRRSRLIVLQERVAPPLGYQLSRLLAYAAVGAIFGAVGASLNLHAGQYVQLLVPAGLALILMGVAFGKNTALGRLIGRFSQRDNKLLGAIALGAATPLLPCGFLYSMAPIAAASGSPVRGASLLAAFALGTSPALLGAALPWRFVQKRLAPRTQTLLRGAACILAALFVLLRAALVVPPSAAAQDDPPVCHQVVTSATKQ